MTRIKSPLLLIIFMIVDANANPSSLASKVKPLIEIHQTYEIDNSKNQKKTTLEDISDSNPDSKPITLPSIEPKLRPKDANNNEKTEANDETATTLPNIEPKLELVNEDFIDEELVQTPHQYKTVSNRIIISSCNGNTVSAVGSSIANKIKIEFKEFLSPSANCVYKIDVPANSILRVEVGYSGFFGGCSKDRLFIGNYAIDLCALNRKGIFNPTFYNVNTISAASPLQISFSVSRFFGIILSKLIMYVYMISQSSTSTSTTSAPNISGCTCGNWSNSLRIVGGEEVQPRDVPHQVGLMYTTSTKPFCGGTLISPNYVLTAAHCTQRNISLRVSLGDFDFNDPNDGQIYINVAQVLNHPDYNKTSEEDNDFSILKLASPASVSDRINFACLPQDVTKTYEGTAMTISGWGRTSFGGQQSPKLLKAGVFGMSNVACKNTGYNSLITPNMICATNEGNTKDTCQGDSGGPMVARDNDRVTLIGVTSFGYGCAMAPFPGVYARVTAQKSWILANTDAAKCQP